jgi:hypothetical protein
MASTCGHTIHLTGGDAFCDDYLDADELNLVCGVYLVSTGKDILLPQRTHR